MPDPLPPGIELRPLPPEDAISYLRRKQFQTTFRWQEMWQEDHTKAFTVAKAMRLDILQDIRAELDRALAEGTTYQEFKKQLTPTLQAKGWWGRQIVQGETVQLGSPHRLATIFQTNIQTALQVGHYRQMTDPAVLAARPYWRYVAVMDNRTRPMHRAWHGTILSADDPWWNTHYPPNGWRCFPEGTPVLTQDGWRPIEAICLHDRVIGGSGQPQLVTATHRNDFHGGLVRLAAKGYVVTATPNHRILTLRGWVRADGLHAGDVLVQTAETPGIEACVGDIDDAHANSADSGMPFPVERKSAVALALDCQVQARDEQIEPLGADSGMDNVIMERRQPLGGQMVEEYPFSSSGIGHAGRMARDMSADGAPMCYPKLGPDLWAPGAGSEAEFSGDTTHGLISLGGLAEARVPTLERQAYRQLSHHGSSAPSSLIGVQPLHFHGLAALAGSDLEVPQQPHQGTHVEMPAGAELPVRGLLIEIETAEDLAGGAPLDRFDTLEDFATWAWSHTHLHVIESVTTIPYSGTVCNLTVEQDKSYIIPGATVHNCRCTVVTVSEGELGRDYGGALSRRPDHGTFEYVMPHTGEVITVPRGIDPGWAYNPGKASVLWDTPPRSATVRPGQSTWRDLGRADLRQVSDAGRHSAPGLLQEAASLDEAAALVAREIGIPDDRAFRTIQTKDGDLAIIHRDRIPHMVAKRDEARERYARYILPTLQDPYEIWLTDYEDGLRKQYVGLFTGPRDLLVVIRLGRDGSALWNIMQSESKRLNNNRVGTLLYGK